VRVRVGQFYREPTLLEVAWQNPHVHFFVRAKEENGRSVTWDIEANSLSILRRTDATAENLKVGGTDANKAAGIFRVWSTKFGEPGGVWRRDYPLTDAAKNARGSFNPLTDSVAPGCRPKGMPTTMEQPYPLEFVKKGDTIHLHDGRHRSGD
jgi:uncharacterized protein DUF6152